MKLDGKAVAHAMLRQKENNKLTEENANTINDVVARGDHIQEMANFIEKVHLRKPEEAHAHLDKYMQHMANKNVSKAID
jgi:hypothetical protein